MINVDQILIEALENKQNYGYHDLSHLSRDERIKVVERLNELGAGKDRVISNIYTHSFRINIYNLKKKKKIILHHIEQRKLKLQDELKNLEELRIRTESVEFYFATEVEDSKGEGNEKH